MSSLSREGYASPSGQEVDTMQRSDRSVSQEVDTMQRSEHSVSDDGVSAGAEKPADNRDLVCQADIGLMPLLPMATFWAGASACAVLAATPAVMVLLPNWHKGTQLPLGVLVCLQMMQVGIMVFLTCLLGLRLGRSIGLGSPLVSALIRLRRLVPMPPADVVLSIACGVAAATFVLILDVHVFASQMPTPIRPLPGHLAWYKILGAALYGGIVEELLLRLFLVSTLAWCIWGMAFRWRVPVPTGVYALAILVSAILFGAGHLPAAATFWPLGTAVVVRTIVLNMVGGLVFGVLFCRRGIEAAMVAHFTADVLLLLVSESQVAAPLRSIQPIRCGAMGPVKASIVSPAKPARLPRCRGAFAIAPVQQVTPSAAVSCPLTPDSPQPFRRLRPPGRAFPSPMPIPGADSPRPRRAASTGSRPRAAPPRKGPGRSRSR